MNLFEMIFEKASLILIGAGVFMMCVLLMIGAVSFLSKGIKKP